LLSVTEIQNKSRAQIQWTAARDCFATTKAASSNGQKTRIAPTVSTIHWLNDSRVCGKLHDPVHIHSTLRPLQNSLYLNFKIMQMIHP